MHFYSLDISKNGKFYGSNYLPLRRRFFTLSRSFCSPESSTFPAALAMQMGTGNVGFYPSGLSKNGNYFSALSRPIGAMRMPIFTHQGFQKKVIFRFLRLREPY